MPAPTQSSTLSVATYPSLHTSIFGDESGSSLFGEGGFLGDMGDIFNSGTFGSGVGPGTSTMTVPRISSFTQFSNQASTTFQPHQDHILQGAAGVGTPHLQQQNQHQQQQLQQQQHTPSPYRHSVPIPIPPSNNTLQQQPEPEKMQNPRHSQPLPQHAAHAAQPPRPQTMYAQGSVADLQKERILAHKASVATMMTTASTASSSQSQSDLSSKPLPSIQPPRGGRKSSQPFETDPTIKAQRDALKQQLKQQQKSQQKKSLPLFPTERTRGSSSIQNALRPVDITQIDLLPIQVSHKIIMKCIDEIKLRGLKHKHLFRSPFYSPSVECALALMVDPRRQSMVSVKWMRMDTVAGLLTTALSRTYPPLIPPHIQELFQNPNGRFFFELLGMLPELNRFLFVEILDLCCDLVDNQLYNQVSHSKLAIYPGSCCFGLDEFMPTWDTRYLLTTDVKKFSTAFYHVIYAYREERDLSAEALQAKLDTRDQILEKERMDALESEYGLEGTFAILRMEARIAKGLPAESPQLEPTPPSNTKEISVYADRKETVVADDAISVLDIQLDENGVGAPHAPALDKVVEEEKEEEEEEENVERVIADLRRSVSVATLVYNPSSSRSNSAASSTDTVVSSKSMTAVASSQSPVFNGYYLYNKSNTSASTTVNPKSKRPTLTRLKSIARFSTIEKNLYPVSPGDIFGISRHAIERKELQEFLSVARISAKQRRSLSSKRILQLRLQNKMLRRQRSTTLSASLSTPVQQQQQQPKQYRHYRQQQQHHHHLLQHQIQSICLQHHHRKLRIHHPAQNHTHWNRHQSLFQQTHSDQTKTPSQRRGRTRQLRKELQVYLDRGLAQEDAIVQNKKDKQKRRRKEKKAKAAAVVAEGKRRQTEKAMMAVAEEQRLRDDITMEEAEVMEAFDYLTDQEFEEFIILAGLTMADVDRIREKAATAALKQLTKDIASVGQSSAKETLQQVNDEERAPPAMAKNEQRDEEVKKDTQKKLVEVTSSEPDAPVAVVPSANRAFEEGRIIQDAPKFYKSRPTSLPKMTSMDLLLKHARVISDSNLRCYPELTVSTPIASTVSSSEETPVSMSSSPATTLGQTSRRPSTVTSTELTAVPEENASAAASVSPQSFTSHSVGVEVNILERSITTSEPKRDSAASSPKEDATTTPEKSIVLTVTQEQKKKISPSSSSSSIPVPCSRVATPDTAAATVAAPARTIPSPIAGLKNKSASSSSSSISSIGKSRVPLPAHDLRKKLAPTPQPSTETTNAVKTDKVPESGGSELKKKSVQDAIKALERGPKPLKSGVRDAIKAFERPSGTESGMGSKATPAAYISKLRPVSRTTTPITPSAPPSVAAASALKLRDALRKTTTATTTAASTTLTTIATPKTAALKSKEDNKNPFVSKSPNQPSTVAASPSKKDTETSKVDQMRNAGKASTTKVNPTKVEIMPLGAKATMTTSMKPVAVSRPKETVFTRVPITAVDRVAIPQFVLEIHTMVDDDKAPQTEENTNLPPAIAPMIKNRQEEQIQMLQIEAEEEEPEDEEAAELRELLDSMSEEERSEFLRLSRS